jgi:hypothetical protein
MHDAKPRRCHLVLEGGKVCNGEGWLHVALGFIHEGAAEPELIQVVLCTKHAPEWLRCNDPMYLNGKQCLHELGDDCQMPESYWCLPENRCHVLGEHSGSGHEIEAKTTLPRALQPA